jgi:hypothetical protein
VIDNPASYGPTPPIGEVIYQPVILVTAAQIASPTAAMIAATNVTYQLDAAPFTRYQSSGVALVPVSATGNAVLSATQTFTGANTFGDGTGSPQLTIDGAAAVNKGVNFRNAGVNRWRLLTDASDNLNLFAYDASGVFLDTAWDVVQSSSTVFYHYKIEAQCSYATALGAVTGIFGNASNIGTNAAYGHRFAYTSTAGSAGFDTGVGIIATFNPVFQGATKVACQGAWFVAESPNDNAHTWGGNFAEVNFVNRGPDIGFKRDRGDAGNNTGGLLFVPESIVLSGGAGEGKNVMYGYSVARSGANNSTGFPVKSYTGYLVEPNAIVGLTGRGSYMTGDITGTASQRPYAPEQFDGTWLHGLDHTLATYIDNHAETFLVGQGLAWIVGTTGTPTATATIAGSGSGSDVTLTITPAGAGVISMAGPTQLKSYIVSGLPAAASFAGCVAYVTDATAPTYNATLTGGGAVKCLAMSNGTAWTAH